MKAIFLSFTILLSSITCLHAQDDDSKRDGEVYKLNLPVDIPLTAIGTGLSIFGFSQIYTRDEIPESEILALDKNDLWKIDRPAAGNFDEKANSTSDLFMYGSIPVPFLLLLDKEMRAEAGTIGVLFLQAFAINGMLYTGSNMLVGRIRPLAYGEDVPMEERIDGGNRNSFIGGHPSVTATACFFTAQVYADFHPESNFKYVLYGAAAAATLGNAALRYKAGKHFPTDLAAGVTVGTLSGLLVPMLHKRRANRTTGWFITPYGGGSASGVNATYRF